jgi:hypothetical protein
MTDLSKKEIERRLAKLEALEAGGVDNWEGYDFAMESWRKEEELYEEAESFIEYLNDVLAEAQVEEPAGRGCGHAISWDEEKVTRHLIELFKKFKKGN